MNTLPDWLDWIVTTLQVSGLCRAVRVLRTEQFSATQFALKVRAELTDGRTLQAHLYRNGAHTDYAYQLLGPHPLLRWDNKEHFPGLASEPHHFHNANGHVVASPLTGDPYHDWPLVLDYLREHRH